MKRDRRKLLWVFLTAGILTMVLWPSAKQPSYQGRVLTEWLDDLVENERDATAIAAVRSIGTNAFPFLLRSLRNKPDNSRSSFFEKASALLIKLRIRSQPLEDSKALQAERALEGFQALGTMGRTAIPALTNLLDTADRGVAAAVALSYMGPEVVPSLTNGLTLCSPRGQYNRLAGIIHCGINAAQAVPAVIVCLGETNSINDIPIRQVAAFALGEIRSHPEASVPALTNLFVDPDEDLRKFAVQSVGKFFSDAEFAIPAVKQILSDSDLSVRERAIDSLDRITNQSPYFIRRFDIVPNLELIH